MASFGFNTTGDEVVNRFRDQVAGKTVLITGASVNGLGAETAITLAKGNPSQLILLTRSSSKANPVLEEISKINDKTQTYFFPVELDKLSSISEAVKQIQATPSIKKIDIVINNAGIMATPYQKNDAGIESQLATNHIGHFYLTKHLQPLIASAAIDPSQPARIINVTSDGYMISPFRFDDPNFSDGATYDRWSGYGQSKTANILFTRQLAHRLASRDVNVRAFAVHPGVIMSTSLASSMDDPSQFNDIPAITKRNTGTGFEMGQPKSAQQGVATALVAALDPGLDDKSGSLLMDCNVVEIREYASSLENAERLWKLSEQLVGEEWDLDQW